MSPSPPARETGILLDSHLPMTAHSRGHSCVLRWLLSHCSAKLQRFTSQSLLVSQFFQVPSSLCCFSVDSFQFVNRKPLAWPRMEHNFPVAAPGQYRGHLFSCSLPRWFSAHSPNLHCSFLPCDVANSCLQTRCLLSPCAASRHRLRSGSFLLNVPVMD